MCLSPTLILITSGYAGNNSLYLYKEGYICSAYKYSILTNLLGFYFLIIQYNEYNHLEFDMRSNVYTSIFYLLTGFHGLHVLIGNLFLLLQYILKDLYIDKKVFGLSIALLY